ncbi:hypothetical protein BDY24DRAFT_168229 [Mrakia frigida]|uniref:uncharacterized protein n=1 Tax=Mrakia frigida TaxID=29902 RepID=UPI003FCBF8A6
MTLFFLGSFLLHIVLTAMDQGTKGSTVDRFDGHRKGEKSSSRLLDLETSGSAVVPPVAVVVEVESKETFADVASLSFLVGCSFLCLVTSLALTFLYKTDSLASLFILPSALTIPCMFFPRHHHRTPLITVTCINLILQSFARASYSLLYVSNVRPVCAIFLLHNPALGITPRLPMECKLSRMLYFVSLLALLGLIARLGVLYSTPTKGKMPVSLEKEGAGARDVVK